jgi:putative transposase
MAAKSAKYWLHALTEIKNRGAQDCYILVCDGLSGLPDAVAQVWPATIVQTCVVHLLASAFRYASKKDWPGIARDLKPVYTAPVEAAALDRFVEFCDTWEDRYPAKCQAVEQRLDRIDALSQLRSADPRRHLHHKRNRES